jgi:Skp family chaperone for outer membrane proteins
MFLSWLMMGVALSLSVIAAFYSIAGLAAIFAAAVVPIVVMGTILEVAKLTVTVWLHEYWPRCRFLMKAYLVPAVALLAFITSMGIFGFLSKAHSDQGMVSGDVQAKIAIYDEKIQTERENIDANRKALKQLDEAVDQVMARSTDEKGADKAVAIRRAQQKDRARLLEEISKSQLRITALNEERAPIAAEVRKVEAEVGPIKYIAALVYGDNTDANILERAVRWVIIILVIVFDPLAIMMLLAATESFKWEKEPPVAETVVDDDKIRETAKEQEPEIPAEPVPEVEKSWQEKYPYLTKPFVHFSNTKPVVYSGNPAEFQQPWPEEKKQELVKVMKDIFPSDDWLDGEEHGSDEEKQAIREWKAANPELTVKAQRELLARGEITELPWARKPNSTFGFVFPWSPEKGDTFIKTDVVPNAMYKFNGTQWMAVDKSVLDSYTHDTAYIDYLISKISSGEYDPELLSEDLRDQVAERIKQTDA